MKLPNRIIADYNNSRVQDFTKASLKDLLKKNQILEGNIVEQLILTSNTEVNHGLGREVTGWFVVNKDANADVWQSGTANDNPTRKIILVSDTPVTAKIYFF